MQSVFERYEKKYLITGEQYSAVRALLSGRMQPDHYGKYPVQNLYYDTPAADVIRASIEKPAYKEKMRLRCYGSCDLNSVLFLELKKKCSGIVYKRRIKIHADALLNRTLRSIVASDNAQISKELDFYWKTHLVAPSIYIAYRRKAWAGVQDEGLRVTFDTDIRFRQENLYFENPGQGQAILPQGLMLMEIKTLGGMPLWLSRALSENGIFPVSFSKYGVSYTNYILGRPNIQKTERQVLCSA